jgi:hypothetical protein
MALEQLVQAMEEPATEDIRAQKVLPLLLPLLEGRVPAAPAKRGSRKRGRTRHAPAFTGRAPAVDPRLRAPIALLKQWVKNGGHRRDLNGDGRYDDDAAVTLMDAWWPNLIAAMFKPTLGASSFDQLRTMIAVSDPIGGNPDAPAFSEGWWGYASKDLRDLFALRKPAGRYSRVYCGGGSRSRCLAALRGSLLASVNPNTQRLYGHGACANDAQASCHDKNRPTVTSAVDLPAFPFQNRPTFQQTIELTRRLPR